jgi:hypothetical protein
VTGVMIGDRTRLLRSYSKCFVGSEMTSWLLFQVCVAKIMRQRVHV